MAFALLYAFILALDSERATSAPDARCSCTGDNKFNSGKSLLDYNLTQAFGADWGKTCQAFMHRCQTGDFSCRASACRLQCYVDSTCPSAMPSSLVENLYWSFDGCDNDPDPSEAATCPWAEQSCTKHEDCTYDGCCSGQDDSVFKFCDIHDDDGPGGPDGKSFKCIRSKFDDRCQGRPRLDRIDSLSWCWDGRLDLHCPQKLANESVGACKVSTPLQISGYPEERITGAVLLIAAFLGTVVHQ